MEMMENQQKRQKLSPSQFCDLPDEVILKILKNLGIKDLIRCGMVSKRMRALCWDESLWEKVNLFLKEVPIEFLQQVLNSGCK